MIRYYLHKIIAKILSAFVYLWRGKNLRRGVFEIVPRDFVFQKKVVLAFWDLSLVHLGDQLFHEALVRYLVGHNVEVYVCGNSPLNVYFSDLGAAAVPLVDLQKKGIDGALFISKDDVAFQFTSLFGKKNAFIGINYAALDTEEKISVEITRIALEFVKKNGFGGDVGVEMRKIDFKPNIPKTILDGYDHEGWMRTLSSEPEKKFLVFNNYVASNFFDVSKRESLLEELCKKKRKEGYIVIHVGSKKDRAADRRKYNFIDFDFRGILDPIALIKLFSLKNVLGVVSFDTYVMHAAALFGKDLYIVVKDESRKEIFRKRFIPMYPGADDILKEYL
jgi:hypothetical protein